jgi:heat shock protein HtpX
MGATMFLLGLVFTGFFIALYFVLFAYGNRHGGGGAGDGLVVIVLLIAGVVAFSGYYWSDKIALNTARARLVTPQQAPQLHGIIDRICALADMPKPRVAISPVSMPNAFATGRSSKVAVVCVTEGLLQRLDDKELEGVLAHEMSHVAHKDVAVMTIASFLGIVAALLVRFAFYSELFGGGGRGRSNNSNQNALPIMLIVMLVGVVVYAVSFLLIRLLSRYRELSAVRAGQRAGEGDRRHRQDPDEGPAEGRAAERVLLHAGALRPDGPAEPVQRLLHAPEPGEAAGAAGQDLQAARQ